MQLWTCRRPIRYTLHVLTSETSAVNVTTAAEENGYGSEGER